MDAALRALELPATSAVPERGLRTPVIMATEAGKTLVAPWACPRLPASPDPNTLRLLISGSSAAARAAASSICRRASRSASALTLAASAHGPHRPSLPLPQDAPRPRTTSQRSPVNVAPQPVHTGRRASRSAASRSAFRRRACSRYTACSRSPSGLSSASVSVCHSSRPSLRHTAPAAPPGSAMIRPAR